jgi:4'-phosphopantetheinyl transferase EntD
VVTAELAAAVGAALAALAPEGVRVGARPVTGADVAALHPGEHALVARAIDTRRHEFATGRALLHALLGTTHARPAPAILATAWRAPVFPAGTCGSLAHDSAVAVAAVGDAATIRAIGIDVATRGSVDAEAATIIRRADDAAVDDALVFAAKEAVYKAWCGLEAAHTDAAPRVLEFHDVRLSVSPDGDDSGAFTGLVLDDGCTLSGRYAGVAGRWLTLATAR